MDPVQSVLAVGAVCGAITVIGIFANKVYKIAKHIEAAIGTDRSGRSISDRLDRVEHHLFPNGGSSLTDKINRMEQDQKVMQGRMDAMERTLLSILRNLEKQK